MAGMEDTLATGWQLIESGDVRGAMRELRVHAANLPPAAIAPLVERVARDADMPDLAAASAALRASPAELDVLYDYGYACIERAASFLAIPALTEALGLAPDSGAVLSELVVALEYEQRHADALSLLQQRESGLEPWPGRYLLAYNALMTGDVALAGRVHADLPEPDDDWSAGYWRLHRMLVRAALVQPLSSLDSRDLRGWHYVLNGSVLSTLSPYGFTDGMTGRWAFRQDSGLSCRFGLERVRVALDAAGVRPRSVSLLPERSSEIIGLAAAEVLDLPARPYERGQSDSLIAAYDLNDVDTVAVCERAPGQILWEHASCWTSPSGVSADICTMLVQHCVRPWGSQTRRAADGSMERTAPDDRPAAEIAADIAGLSVEDDDGDGETPPDPDAALAAFVAGVRENWLSGNRDYAGSAGPVRSSRFS